MMWNWWGWPGAMWMLACTIALVLLIAWCSRSPGATPSARRDGARDLLDERFARGDIDAAELHARRRELGRP